jgi:hypothetical protein
MKTSNLANLYAGIATAVFVIVTAWGNAIAMFVVGVIGCVVGLLIFRKTFAGVGTLVAVTSCLVAAIVAWALHHS